MAKKISKNDASSRKKTVRFKSINGKNVVPVLYKGGHKGHGDFMAAKFEGGSLALGSDGIPLHYSAAVFIET